MDIKQKARQEITTNGSEVVNESDKTPDKLIIRQAPQKNSVCCVDIRNGLGDSKTI